MEPMLDLASNFLDSDDIEMWRTKVKAWYILYWY